MYELKLSKPAIYRVKEGQTSSQIAETFGCPVPPDIVCGDIVFIFSGEMYSARVGDTYSSIAARFGVDVSELERLNGKRPVYPTCKIIIPPCRRQNESDV